MTAPTVLALLPPLRRALAQGAPVILQAPPGAGKSTVLPPALLDEEWLAGGRILLLEPRRIAARAVAGWMAAQRGEAVGGTVGYRVRGESRVGPRTRIEVVTEGILTRILQSDPELGGGGPQGVGLLIFDEFHERSLQADLGLALALQVREVLRPDLRLLVMSATLETGALADVLEGSVTLTTPTTGHPVQVEHRMRPLPGAIEPGMAAAVRRALHEEEGDILAFLPGAGEIRRTAGLLADPQEPGALVLPLHGSLSREEQDRALSPPPPGLRRVVLATDIAETSLTLEGVRVVIDGGLSRVPRFDPRSGMGRLETVRVSRASAEQRRGRAGRTAPGVCYRLWTEGEHAALPERGRPEILEADLAPLALELAVWGVPDPASLQWIDPPPPGAFQAARDLLSSLGALDAAGSVTPHGRAMAGTGVHPRVAHLLLTAAARGAGAAALACDLAALLEERELLVDGGGRDDPDLTPRLFLLRGGREPGFRADSGALHRIREESRRLARMLGVRGGGGSDPEVDAEEVGRLVCLAFPDRIGVARRGGDRGRFLLANGRGAFLAPGHPLAGAEAVVAARLQGAGREERILLAAPLPLDSLREVAGAALRSEEVVAWDPTSRGVTARREERLGAIVLRSSPLPDPDPARLLEVLLEGIRGMGVDALPWGAEALLLRQRVAFLGGVDAGLWPDLTSPALERSLEDWLAPWLTGIRSVAALSPAVLERALELLLPPGWRGRLEVEAPTHIEVPTGSRIALDYSDPGSPVLAVRLQELFGLAETPRIAAGRVPLTLHLLSPARRPVQVTRDLASFWRSAYAEVRRELRGRYPKHAWPEDPARAAPVRGVQRRS